MTALHTTASGFYWLIVGMLLQMGIDWLRAYRVRRAQDKADKQAQAEVHHAIYLSSPAVKRWLTEWKQRHGEPRVGYKD